VISNISPSVTVCFQYSTGIEKLQSGKNPRGGNIVKKEKIVTDPNGSYTGRPADPKDKPVQDADDL